MSFGPHSRQEVAGASVVVAVTVLGMVAGIWLHISGLLPHIGWFLFIVSFGLWMFGAIAAMLILWNAGYLDR